MFCASPVLLNVVPADVPICTKLEHPTPAQLSIRYCVTPMLSVEAVQLKLICEPLTGVAASPLGAVGATVSGPPEPAARKATICMTHRPDVLNVAVPM